MTDGEEPTAEQFFAEFKSFAQIHLHQILKLDRKPPNYAVALLVAVACEQPFPRPGRPSDSHECWSA